MEGSKPDLEMADVSGIVKTNDQLVKRNDQISIKLKTDICYLKTQSQSFKQFEIRLEGNTLNFSRQSKTSQKTESKFTNSL